MKVFERHQVMLQEVDEKLYQVLKTGNSHINGSMDYLSSMKGKKIRPLLYLLGTKIAGEKANIEVATALEMLHVATLIHDDVIDESKLRRNQESIQSKYSKDYAVYMGDYLFSSLFLLLSESPMEREDMLEIARMMQKICVAEMHQYHQRYNIDMGFLGYLRIVSGKTAALFSLSLAAGSKDKNRKKILLRLGYRLGVAFQIQDDLLDFKGDEQCVGKDLRQDLARGNYSLPIILAYEAFPQTTKMLLEEDSVAQEKLFDLLDESGALAKTEEVLQSYYEKIEKDLEKLDEYGGSEELRELIAFIKDRKH
jgi:heptaprenyl diphosphate synthase